DIACENDLLKIQLTVNKYNDKSIAAYKKMGFVTVKEQVADIGGGYIMDDFVMEYSLEDKTK
ncbi:MAG: GNAT family N-acetyltransferase, partial [Carnobacterium sp.]